MGGGQTKIISYDDALKRLNWLEVEQIEATFRNLTSPTYELSLISFKRDVFANFLPEKLASRLYQISISPSKSCMTLKDLICCLAIVFDGYFEERIELLYLLFSYNHLNGNFSLRWKDVKEFLLQCGDNPPEELDTVFANPEDAVTLIDFRQWLQTHRGHTTTITDWLMVNENLNKFKSKPSDRLSDQYTVFSSVTHLSDVDVKELEKTYYSLCTYSNLSRQQLITLQTFSNILAPALPPILIPGLFNAFDENHDGIIDFKEFVFGISSVCRGPILEKYKFLFRVFDRENTHRLDRPNILHMASCLIDVAQFVYAFTFQMNDSPDTYTNSILNENENNTNEYFTEEDFINWCPTNMFIKELLELIFQICHIVLGLPPASKQDEIVTVKQYLRREQYPFVEAKSNILSKTYHWINCNRATSKPGAPWYLISMEWWTRWYSMLNTTALVSTVNRKGSQTKLSRLSNGNDYRREIGEIDNSSLIDKNSTNINRIYSDDCVQIQSNIYHKSHFEMVPESLWLFLCKYYRCKGQAICRRVTYRKTSNKPELDLYPLLIKIYRNQILSSQQIQSIATNNSNINDNNSNSSMLSVYPLVNYFSSIVFGPTTSTNSILNNPQRHYLSCSYFVSPYQTVRSLAEELSTKFVKPLEEFRLWFRYSNNDLFQIDIELNGEKLCQDVGFRNNSEILFETRNSDLTWPEELYTLATRSRNEPVNDRDNDSKNSVENDKEERGTIGLSNLGNTCFLNAAVQCLSHSAPLTFYFLHKYHLFEINKDNPIGMQGNIALRYGQLLTKLWSGLRGPLAPFELRDSVAKFGSSRFTDFQQHDSQEFLSFLLDGLHEDLNRVHTKPYVELKDSDDRPDEDVAYEHWSNHLARNTSIIVDLFHGLLRSQVKCSVCDTKSVRFDPFNILSLPLPIDTSIYIEIKLVRIDGSRPMRYGLRMDGDAPVSKFTAELSNLSSIPIDQIGFFDTASSYGFLRKLSIDNSPTKIKHTNFTDLVAYELPPNSKQSNSSDEKENSIEKPSLPYIIGIHRRLEQQERYISPLLRFKTIFFGQPILIPYKTSENQTTNKDIYVLVSNQLARLLRKNTNSLSTSNVSNNCSSKENFPFVLTYVSDDGKRCSLCSWNRFCFGCSFEPDEQKFKYTIGNIAIEWEQSAYYLRYLSHREQDVDIHSSVKPPRSSKNDSNNDDPSSIIRLEDCLESFIKWESLDNRDLFNCKRCKQLQPTEKKLDIWKLPPCLIFHLKRFQLSNNRWIKSSQAVRFPIQSFFPSKYLAKRSPSMKTVSSSSSLKFRSADDQLTTSLSSSSLSSSSTDNMFILTNTASSDGISQNFNTKFEQNIDLPPLEMAIDPIKKRKRHFGRRKKNTIETNSEMKLNPPRFSQMEDRTFSGGDNSFDAHNSPYNLYAFVCHFGVINGGHYVAFVKNFKNQKWYCFNDSSCKPVSENVLQQYSASAYLLFYQRECLDHRRYMPNVEGKKPIVSEDSLTNDDRWCSIM